MNLMTHHLLILKPVTKNSLYNFLVDQFGEEDLFLNPEESGIRSFTAKAIEDCELLVINEKVF